MLRKVLIANRGEIAVRVIRTCHDLGIECVAVYSDADRTALHVRLANEAVRIGPAPPSESYLKVDAILDAAKRTGADSIHPGYGFLSEKAHFAKAVEDAGLTFIGPPSSAMRAMGDKLSSRTAMSRAGVPIVPGLTEPVADVDAARREAEKVGWPIALKAAGGGGGKGIRVVRAADELASAFRTASGEAASAFGDSRLYIERYLPGPRHVEVQILADRHGNVAALGERECSIQRRHQKLIEETPSPAVDDDARERLADAAVRAAKAVGYANAGTVEFLWSEGRFYFLEMNCRLQVEHPVTEMVYGVDLVREQLRVAAGEPLAIGTRLRPRGHAIEARVNAEDPDQGFLPSIGTVLNLRLPAGPNLRVDSGLFTGYEVTPHYDSLLAKVVAWGSDRAEAIARLERALRELHVGGVKTTAPLALRVLRDPRFREGRFDTGFLDGFAPTASAERERVVAILAAVHRHLGTSRRALGAAGGNGAARPDASRDGLSPWVRAGRLDGGMG
ncbi:MAG TPA: acetyl-CoA carboxylase biotin carboxylase subunit [Planctomycetota bacterium]|nr:acetyl-CoA carboxylase biotin carboxylase subunit [Planctomycetota bacterium]